MGKRKKTFQRRYSLYLCISHIFTTIIENTIVRQTIFKQKILSNNRLGSRKTHFKQKILVVWIQDSQHKIVPQTIFQIEDIRLDDPPNWCLWCWPKRFSNRRYSLEASRHSRDGRFQSSSDIPDVLPFWGFELIYLLFEIGFGTRQSQFQIEDRFSDNSRISSITVVWTIVSQSVSQLVIQSVSQ